MTRYILIILFLFGSFIAEAQLVLFEERFDHFPGYNITGWPYEFTGFVPWECGLPYQVGGCMKPTHGPMSKDIGTDKVACIPDCGPLNPNDSNVLMYTPHISLAGHSGAWLKYDSYFEHYSDLGDTEKATVEVSLDTGRTWVVVQTVQANVSLGNFDTHFIDLGAYNNAPDIRIGFRYSDGGNGAALMGWAIDNVMVFVPAHKDISVTQVTPSEPLQSYVQVGRGVVHAITVFNEGIDTIHQFTLSYQQVAGAVQSQYYSGMSIPPFTSARVTINRPDTVWSQGTFPVTVWATLDSDSYQYNDTMMTALRGAEFIPSKVLTLESGEALWNGWSPRNIAFFNSIPGHDQAANLISVHELDPISDSVYSDFLYNLHWNYVTYMLFDRRTKVPLDSLNEYFNEQKNYFGFAALDAWGNCDGHTLSVNVNVKPAIDLSGDYRLALVVTEDGITGYQQANYYAGGINGPMGGFELLPNPIPASQNVCNHIARQIAPAPDGGGGLLPSSMSAGTSYTANIVTNLNPAWNTSRLRGIILLINNSDSTILNSTQLPFALGIQELHRQDAQVSMFPNPATETVNLVWSNFSGSKMDIVVNDLSGRTIFTTEAISLDGSSKAVLPVAQIPDGIYIVNLYADGLHKMVKLLVQH